MKIEPRMFTLPNGEVLTVRSLCADDAEALSAFRNAISVSYTHLDVYKRQVEIHHDTAQIKDDIFIHRCFLNSVWMFLPERFCPQYSTTARPASSTVPPHRMKQANCGEGSTMKFRELCAKEIVQLSNGACLGRADDLELDPATAQVKSLLLLGQPHLFGLLLSLIHISAPCGIS